MFNAELRETAIDNYNAAINRYEKNRSILLGVVWDAANRTILKFDGAAFPG